MPYDYNQLDKISRLLVEAELKVLGSISGRFQPTNFPDLGAALYRGADGRQWLLVESPQSMANRMERVCWLDGDGETDRVGRYNDACRGIPHVLAVDADDRPLTASPLEAHRLASPYLWDALVKAEGAYTTKTLGESLKDRFKLSENRLVPWKTVASELLQIDPACLIHGIWFNDADFAGGKVRLTRALSGYIEASDPSTANFGFQKRDAVSDRTDKDAGQTAVEGFGSVIGPKQQFTSGNIKAYFQLDLDRLRSYGLSVETVRALAAWGIYKIRRVLVDGRDGVGGLRTECKFTSDQLIAMAYDANTGVKLETFALPQLDDDLRAQFGSLRCLKRTDQGEQLDADIAITKVRWIPKVEGKAEVQSAIARNFKFDGLSGKAVIKAVESRPKRGQAKTEPKTFLVLSGELRTSDKVKLREQNPSPDLLKVVESAIRNYEERWSAKVQGTKTKSGEGEESEGEAENG